VNTKIVIKKSKYNPEWLKLAYFCRELSKQALVSTQRHHYLLFILAALFLLVVGKSMGQKLMKSGSLAPIVYEFTGLQNYKSHPDLVHALAYSNHKDVRNIVAKEVFNISFRVVKLDKKGFETKVCIYPRQISGDVMFYRFRFPQLVLPRLSWVKLVMKDRDEYIYVKNKLIPKNENDTLIFTFRHQRFSPDWEIYLEAKQWDYEYSKTDFVDVWHWINDYQSAWFLLNQERLLTSPENAISRQLYKERWLAVYHHVQSQDFYQFLIHDMGQDPYELVKNMEIRKFVLEREMMELQKNNNSERIQVSMQELAQDYLRVDIDLLQIAQKDIGLYSGFSFSFDSIGVYCFDELSSCLAPYSKADKRQFEMYYQKLSMQLIEEEINTKNPQEALAQIERFERFAGQSSFIQNSVIFQHFKSRAVYDIYLAYIQVARQAIDAGRIEMAMDYLDQATSIQQAYPREIINDIYVEKELQKLVKKALERYRFFRESGDNDSADQVKKGIQGMLKRYGYSGDISSFNNS